MAKRASFDVAAGRRYLAGLPEFAPTKPLADYKAATIKRYVTQFQQQARAGVPLSRQAARGHVVTPEHGPKGKRPRLPAQPREYRGGQLPKSKYLHKTVPLKQPRIHRRPINVPERLDLSEGAVVYTYPDVEQVIARLQALGDSWRIVLSGFDCDANVYRSLGIRGQNSRHTAEDRWTAEQLLEVAAGSGLDFEDWFITVANSTSSDDRQTGALIGHVCLWSIYAYPINRHLRRPTLRAPVLTR